MSSLWDSFAQKIYSGKIQVEEIVELIEFMKEFDNVHNNIIINIMRSRLKDVGSSINMDFQNWDVLENYVKTGSVHRVILEYLIGELHSFDHENEQVIMNSFDKNKHYWTKHKIYRNWMGTFKEGKWIYSKQYKELQTNRVMSK